MMTKDKLTGLVVCGGASSRMGRDKSLLKYHDQEQRYHIADMLSHYCKDVYLSLNESQISADTAYKAFIDLPQYSNCGPMAALLTAYHFLPDSNLIVVGCDYPLLTSGELESFMSSLNNSTSSKAFYNEEDRFYEPLLAYYAASMARVVKVHFEYGNTSLQHILKECGTEQYFPKDKNSIKSVDDPAAYEQVKEWIKQNKGGSIY
ncbi:MAG: NTP transferase domain-containing protein [Taibaiella sp.]|jgi:molybdopterin-guanine dinucleotide biosynthesis protein A